MLKFPALLAALATLPATGQVVINEVSASNMSTVADNYGENEDWVELYNTTGAAVDLSGWYLSNKVSNPLKWAFPAGSSIAANGRIMVWCSKRNEGAGGNYHTNFKLDQSDLDHVVLSDAGGTLVDDVALAPATKTDDSRGRTTDGASTWSLFLNPTPNAANAGASPEYAPRPQISPAAGYSGGSVSVTLSGADAGSTIRYTLDGSEPTTTSTAYTAPFAVNATSVVRAACFSATPGVPSSFMETNTYFINATHTTAILSIAGEQLDDLLNGDGGIAPYGSFEYFGADGVLRDEATGQFNEHGNDSWAYGQRGFDYITRDQAGYNDGIHWPIFHASTRDKFQRLIIKPAANDNYPFETGGAHIRDAYVHSLAQSGNMKLDVRTYEPCVLYVNGQYWGVYEIREKCDDHDYTKEYFDQDEYDLQYLKTWGGTWSEYGGPQAQTDWDALKAYVMGNNMGDAAAFAYVDGQFNWKSLVDYAVLNSYTVCTDWLNWNTAWWRGFNPDGEHKKWGYALWDNDATFGHYINYTNVPSTTPDADPCNAEALPDPGGQGHIPILQKLIDENPTVHDYYVNRYIDLGNTTFSCQHMLPYLDSLIALISPEMPAQIARWGGTVAEWEANVLAMRNFIEARCTDIQAGLVDCYDLGGPYNVVFKVDPPLSGDININSITPPAYPFMGPLLRQHHHHLGRSAGRGLGVRPLGNPAQCPGQPQRFAHHHHVPQHRYGDRPLRAAHQISGGAAHRSPGLGQHHLQRGPLHGIPRHGDAPPGKRGHPHGASGALLRLPPLGIQIQHAQPERHHPGAHTGDHLLPGHRHRAPAAPGIRVLQPQRLHAQRRRHQRCVAPGEQRGGPGDLRPGGVRPLGPGDVQQHGSVPMVGRHRRGQGRALGGLCLACPLARRDHPQRAQAARLRHRDPVGETPQTSNRWHKR
jgi:hypothetical protein